MIEVEVLENRIYFRKGIRLAGPIDPDEQIRSIVKIAGEFSVRPNTILCLYLENRDRAIPSDSVRELIDDASGAKFALQYQT